MPAPTDRRSEPELLHPVFRDALERVTGALRAEGWQPRVIETWRSPERHALLRAQGASRAAWSCHQHHGPDGRPASLAADVIDRNAGYKSRPFFERLAELGEAEGLVSGHRWGWDSAHLQAIPVDRQDEVRAGEDPLPWMECARGR